ncbi:hypothetical protein GCM10017711_00850 [Paeniglutamicibacter sulfureus]
MPWRLAISMGISNAIAASLRVIIVLNPRPLRRDPGTDKVAAGPDERAQGTNADRLVTFSFRYD